MIKDSRASDLFAFVMTYCLFNSIFKMWTEDSNQKYTDFCYNVAFLKKACFVVF